MVGALQRALHQTRRQGDLTTDPCPSETNHSGKAGQTGGDFTP